ncbi:MAG: sugar MFS transporter [Sphingobium sp.]
MKIRAQDGGFPSARRLKPLIFLMFAIFAMATDAIGTTLPHILADYHAGAMAAGSLHYASLSGIGAAAIGLGFLADRIGRKAAMLCGLFLCFLTSALFVGGSHSGILLMLLFVSGLGVGLFRSAILALVGALSRSTRDHAVVMNLVEGSAGIGAILGPVGVAILLQGGANWKWVYLIAALLCSLLISGTIATPLPRSTAGPADDKAGPRDTMRLFLHPHALFFAALLMLCVGAEMAIYVWAPIYFTGYQGPNATLAALIVSLYLLLRTLGRFIGAWLLSRFDWAATVAVCSGMTALLFGLALMGGHGVAALALPAAGLFLSPLYPTLNSVGISCFDKGRHGSIAGFLLFFACLAMVISPLAMAAASERIGGREHGLTLGSMFALMLAIACLWNALARPVAARLAERDGLDYGERRFDTGQ